MRYSFDFLFRQVQSVIQANPSGVIQTAAGTQQQQQQAQAQALAAATAMHKGVGMGVVYVAKPANTVIHTSGNAVQVRNKVRSSFQSFSIYNFQIYIIIIIIIWNRSLQTFRVRSNPNRTHSIRRTVTRACRTMTPSTMSAN